MSEVTFREDTERNFETITFRLDRWSGKGFDASTPHRESFDVETSGRKRQHEEDDSTDNDDTDNEADTTDDDDDDATSNEAVSERLGILKTFTAAGHEWVRQEKSRHLRRFEKLSQTWHLKKDQERYIASIVVHSDGKTVIFHHSFNKGRKWGLFDITDVESAQEAVDSVRGMAKQFGIDH
jgi:hypothetical protein